MPNDFPKRRLTTGPNTILSKRITANNICKLLIKQGMFNDNYHITY